MSTLKVNYIQANTTSEIDINSPLGTIPSLDVSGSATIGGNLNITGVSTFTGNSYVAGSLGIGTNNPSDILHLQGIFRIDRQLAAQDQTYIRYFRQGTAKARFGLLADDSSIFFNATNSDTANHLVINSSGNIGVGSASPSAKLDIVGGGTAQLQVTGTEADVWLKSTGPGNTVWRILGSITNNTHRFRIYDQTNNAERFAIDSSGRVTIPNQPSCSIYLSTNQNITSATWTQLNINTSRFNTGNNFNTSTYTFTAPVAGKYFISYTVNFALDTTLNGGGSYLYTSIKVNGAFYHYGQGFRNSVIWKNDTTLSAGQLVNLAANDTVNLWAYSDGNNLVASGDQRSHLAVHLLG